MLLPDSSKLAINPKNNNDVTICWHDLIINFFWGCFVYLVKFSYWCKFHVNIITGSRVMVIFIYKGFGNTPVWVLLNIWRLWRVRDMKVGTDTSNKMLLNVAKCQGYSFHRFCIIKGKPTGMGGGRGRGGGGVLGLSIVSPWFDPGLP